MKYLLMLPHRHRGRSQGGGRTRCRDGPLGTVHQEMEAAGVLVTGIGLENDTAATTLRARAGERVLTDGPFAETKELPFSFMMIESRIWTPPSSGRPRCPASSTPRSRSGPRPPARSDRRRCRTGRAGPARRRRAPPGAPRTGPLGGRLTSAGGPATSMARTRRPRGPSTSRTTGRAPGSAARSVGLTVVRDTA